MKSKIHQSPEEKLAESQGQSVETLKSLVDKVDNSTKSIKDLNETVKDKGVEITGFTGVIKSQEATVEAIDALHESISDHRDVVSKLDEVKSASLINNKLLKEIRDKEEQVYPTKMEVTIPGLSLMKGEKGDIGERGPIGKTGEKGDKGDSGKNGIGIQGVPGKDGVDGKDSIVPGPKGDTGDDGSPDTPEDVVDKVNNSTTRINSKQIKGLDEVYKQVSKYGSNPQGKEYGGWTGGANAVNWRTSGTKISDFVTDINFGSGITATYANNGQINVSSSGGATTPTGTGFTHITAGVQDAASKLVDTADINASQVTYAKIQNVSTNNRLLGRATAGAGVVEEITLGTNLSLSGTTLNATGGGGVAWGAISGTLSAQTDLQTALNLKATKAFAIAMACAL